MITKRTVLILGAGASAAYGFPTGLGLYRSVCTSLGTSSLMRFGFVKEDINKFYEALMRSGTSSVDAFLERRTEFIDIGKLAIASTLLPTEDTARLFAHEIESQNWYKHLWAKMNSPFEKLAENNLAFITYNYDRSCEHFLMTAMQNLYGQPETECAELLKGFPIVHLHGRFGPLPWEGADGIPYFPNVQDEVIRRAASNIKIIHEHQDIDKVEEFRQAKELIQQAEVICFLGFGYNPVNVDRLKQIGLLEGKAHIYGTAKGIGDEDRKSVVELFKDHIHLPLRDLDIMKSFRHFVRLQ